MGGEESTEEEARHSASLIWPGMVIKLEPGVNTPTQQEEEHDRAENPTS